MTIQIQFKRIARPGGGLFLGLRYHFATSIADWRESDNQVETQHWKQSGLCIGLVFWQITIEFQYGHWME